MGTDSGGGRLLGMALLAALGVLAISAASAPLGLSPEALPSPDLLFCVVAHFALRAPAAAPVLLVFALGLARDLVGDGPVGLGALVLVLAAEGLKAQRAAIMRQPLPLEWLAVCVAAAAGAAALWLGIALSLAPPPDLALLGRQLALTAALYPVVSAVLGWGLRIRPARAAPLRGGEAP